MDKLDLNNKIILLRKSLKSIFNQTKLNLSRKIKNLKKNEKQKQSALRKESEFEALKRLKPIEIPLCDAVHSDKLQKTLTNPTSNERDRAIARVLLNPLVQKTIKQLKEKLGPETVETFLKDNEKNIKNNIKQKLENPKKPKDKKKKVKKEVELEESAESNAESDQDGEESNEEEAIEKSESESEKILDEENDENSGKDDDDASENEPELEKPEKMPKPVKNLPVKAANDLKPPKRKRFKEEVVKKSTDSFFMDSTGQNYLAAVADGNSTASEEDEAPLMRKQPQKVNKIMQGKKFKPILTKKFDETPPARRQQQKKPDFKAKQPQKKFETQQQKKFESKPQKKFEPQPVKKPEVKPKVSAKPDDGDIHPSWKAKAQMRKTQIQNFQGTKIKFDD